MGGIRRVPSGMSDRSENLNCSSWGSGGTLVSESEEAESESLVTPAGERSDTLEVVFPEVIVSSEETLIFLSRLRLVKTRCPEAVGPNSARPDGPLAKRCKGITGDNMAGALTRMEPCLSSSLIVGADEGVGDTAAFFFLGFVAHALRGSGWAYMLALALKSTPSIHKDLESRAAQSTLPKEVILDSESHSSIVSIIVW